MCGQHTVDQYWPVNANRFILYSRSGYTDPTAKAFKTAQAKLNADAWGTWAPPESTVRGFFQMWNFIGDADNVFEMRLRSNEVEMDGSPSVKSTQWGSTISGGSHTLPDYLVRTS